MSPIQVRVPGGDLEVRWLVGHELPAFPSVDLAEAVAKRFKNAKRADVASVLAPLAVAPSFQKQGIGAALVRGGLKRLADRIEPAAISEHLC